jgi:hypothetical protein
MGNRKAILQLHDCKNPQPKFMYYLHKSLAPPREINQIQMKSDGKRTQGTFRTGGENQTSSIRALPCAFRIGAAASFRDCAAAALRIRASSTCSPRRRRNPLLRHSA